ncbi:Copper amine oxidase [Handroanthus impetiginosus]|uniref:Amine oxidase n=1 Tax=Handroanthus impetiginosus TaxID=429701 RepID=A0A2G9GSB4_9LAMI|nr:Copper amine oxidase [Handroanthus impetiginosus]
MCSLIRGPSFRILLLSFLTLNVFILVPTYGLHPLDALTRSELNQVQTLVKKSYKNANFHYVGLDEPEKSKVISWHSQNQLKTKPVPFLDHRRAFVLIRVDSKSHEILVDLTSNSILSDKVYDGNGYAMLNNEEQEIASALPLKYPPFIASMAKRGLNVSKVLCEAFTIGWYGEKNTKRVVTIMCYYNDGTTLNFYMRPIEGIKATVNLDQMKIVDYHDRLMIPVPKADGTDYRESVQNPPFDTRIKGMTILQPDGPSFTLDGNHVRWANWDFHLALDMRVGPVISLASIYDHEMRKHRRVMYRGYISEMFVPYQDMGDEWYTKTFLDAGEFGFGICAMPLQPLKDCPKNAVFFDGYYTTRDGTPARISNVFCIFERYAGDVMWRHSEAMLPGEDVITEVRPDVTLVVRMVSTVANYDYMIDWEFKQSGSIKVTTSLSGMLAVKGSMYTHTDQIEEEVYGTLVAENTIGIRHDHFLNFHLDLDIDGETNSLMKAHLQMVKVSDESSPRKSYWKVVHEIIVVNPNKKTKVGNYVGYHLIPGSVIGPLLWEEDHQQIRGAFTNYNVWVTPYNKSEKYAGGLYVDQAHGDDNIAKWTLRNRDIENKDIVLWYTQGFHHAPQQEDFPIMPTLSGGFELRPSNFFDYNPVLKVISPKPAKWVNCSAKPT